MQLRVRRAKPEDARELGRICYDAFKLIGEQHGFASDFPSMDSAIGLVAALIVHPGFYAVAGEVNGRLVGSNFLDERSPIAGIGPITIDPAQQDQAAGRQLMQAVLERAQEKRFPGVRLVQAAFHNRSMALYTKLGFQVRELLSCLYGEPPHVAIDGCRVRPATAADLPDCNRLCLAVHGHDRAGELSDAVRGGTAQVVERGGEITGYVSTLGFSGHAVGAANDDVKALIGAAQELPWPGILLPSRNHELFTWCLNHGLRVMQPLTLMTIGLYNEPVGAYLPSILY